MSIKEYVCFRPTKENERTPEEKWRVTSHGT
jgi:hypothetical protein